MTSRGRAPWPATFVLQKDVDPSILPVCSNARRCFRGDQHGEPFPAREWAKVLYEAYDVLHGL